MKVAILTTDLRDDHRRYSEPEPSFGTAPTALLQGFAKTTGCEVHVISCVQQPVASPVKILGNLFYHSVHVKKRGWLRGAYVGCILAVRKKLREINPDLVHGQGTERYCALSAVFSGFPNIVTIHGNMRIIAKVNGAKPFTFDWLAARLEGFTIPRSDGVVCITHYTRQAVSQDGVPTWVVPNAVDGDFFGVVPEPAPEPIILFIGHITLRKNQNAFIQALDRVVEKRPLRLVCLGLGSETDLYAHEFHSLASTRPWVEYVRWADRPALRERLRTASLVALPSLEDNCPMAVLEGMASGVPIVASNVGGVPDLVEDGVTGLFCDPLDESSMAAAVDRILGDASLSATLARNAREKALRLFLPVAVAQRHLEIYRQVLARDAGPVER